MYDADWKETAFRWPCSTEINASFYAAPICFYLEIDFPFLNRLDFNHARTILMNADRDDILSSEQFVHSLITNAYEIQILTDVVLWRASFYNARGNDRRGRVGSWSSKNALKKPRMLMPNGNSSFRRVHGFEFDFWDEWDEFLFDECTNLFTL